MFVQHLQDCEVQGADGKDKGMGLFSRFPLKFIRDNDFGVGKQRLEQLMDALHWKTTAQRSSILVLVQRKPPAIPRDEQLCFSHCRAVN